MRNCNIREVARLLQEAMEKVQVLTIAISPDCLIGDGMKEKWDNEFRSATYNARRNRCFIRVSFPRKHRLMNA